MTKAWIRKMLTSDNIYFNFLNLPLSKILSLQTNLREIS